MLKSAQCLIVIVVLSLLLLGCAGTSRDAKTVVVTPAIKGNSASLAVGDTLEIHIPTIPKPGFEWQVQDLDQKILLQEGSAAYTADTAPDSAGGMVILKFVAVGAGSTTLVLLYATSGSDGSPAVSANSFGMTVTVK